MDEITTDMELVHRAESGHGESLSFLGGLYYDKKQYKKAIGWYTLAAFRVHQFSLVRLAHMYHTGRGVAKPDYATAFELYSKASMNGNATATNNVGCMYAKGHGVTQSIASALKWYKAAANMGSSNAQFNLGFHHEKGTAGQVNIDLALYFYEKSAAGGTKKAEKAIKRLNKKGHQLFTRQSKYSEKGSKKYIY